MIEGFSVTMIIRSDLDPWLVFVAVAAFVVSVWISRTVVGVHRRRGTVVDEMIGLIVVGAICAALTGLLLGDLSLAIWPLLAFLGGTALVRWATGRFSLPGASWLALDMAGPVAAWLWTAILIAESDLSYGLKLVSLLGLTATLGVSILSGVERIAREAVLTHGRWKAPIRALSLNRFSPRPMVSIHLCCYAEPPEIVKETMNRLAALDYDNFEVLVCDNNTKDEALWRPLERHARDLNARLGEERFRFFHVAPLPGAKAGALNFCLEQMAPEAELVGVIDADYFSKPDFLSRLVPFFENPRIAYVQTPHDYRAFTGNPYLTGCYWEYMPNNKIDMPGVSEYGGAFTIGTMCLLRTQVLRKVGGWAEWCLTEDSEVSVRLRAAGYKGLYLSETFGRGLIPDNFDDYKKQRFRWTAGPVQQLRRHWRLFLPAPFGPPMPGWTKLLEILRCASPILMLVGLVSALFVLTGIATASITGERQVIDVPNVVWTLIGLSSVTWAVRTWHRYRLTGTNRIPDMIRGEVARAALTYVVLVAGIAGLSSKPLAWRRTPKFGNGDSFAGALSSALPETVLGIVTLLVAIAVLAFPVMGIELSILAGLSLGALSFRFLCAPYMALLALKGEDRNILPGPDESGVPPETEWTPQARAA